MKRKLGDGHSIMIMVKEKELVYMLMVRKVGNGIIGIKAGKKKKLDLMSMV